MILPRWWQRRFLNVELVLAVLVTASVLVWCEWFEGYAVVDDVLGENRPGVYGTLASIFGSLFGFVIASVAIVLGYADSSRLRVIRESKYYRDLWNTFVAAIHALGGATIAALLALVLDRPEDPQRFVFILLVGASVLAVLRLLRTGWVLERVIGLITRPKGDGERDLG